MPHRNLTRSSRVALLWGLAAYVVFQLGVFWRVEAQRRTQSVPQLETAAAQDRFARTPINLLMLGSSRTANGLNPSQLEARFSNLEHRLSVLNAGMAGAGPATELLLLRRLTKRGLQLDHVLIEVAPTLLAKDSDNFLESEMLPLEWLYADELLVVAKYGLKSEEARRAFWQHLLAPAYGHRVRLQLAVAPEWLPLEVRTWPLRAESFNWQPNTRPTAEEYRRGLQRAWEEHGLVLQRFQLAERPCAALRDLLAECQAQGIARALVLMPEGSEFRRWCSSDGWRQLEQFLQDLSAEYAAPLINAREWVPDSHFADGHHLLRSGAELFTERLGREYLGPWLAGVGRVGSPVAGRSAIRDQAAHAGAGLHAGAAHTER